MTPRPSNPGEKSLIKYIILLRGVNISGKNRVSKTAFQAILEGLGFSDITIYLNSGNALFTSRDKPRVEDIQEALEGHFGFSIPTLLFSNEQFDNITTRIPSGWTYDSPNPAKKGSFSHVVFLFGDADSPKLIEDIGYNPKMEECTYLPGAILHTVRQEYWAKSWLTKLMNTKAYSLVSVRNINTAHRLSELVSQ